MMSQINKTRFAAPKMCGKSIMRSVRRAITSPAARRAAMFVVIFLVAALETWASSTGAGGFTKATTEISSYQTPVSNLMKAIAAVIVLVGAFNVFFKLRASVEGVCQMPL